MNELTFDPVALSKLAQILENNNSKISKLNISISKLNEAINRIGSFTTNAISIANTTQNNSNINDKKGTLNTIQQTLIAIEKNTSKIESTSTKYDILDVSEKIGSLAVAAHAIYIISKSENAKKILTSTKEFTSPLTNSLISSLQPVLQSISATASAINQKIGKNSSALKDKLSPTTTQSPSHWGSLSGPEWKPTSTSKPSVLTRATNIMKNIKIPRSLMLGGALLGGATALGALSSSSAHTPTNASGADTSSAQSAVTKMLQLSERLKQNIFDRIPDCVKLMADKTGSFLGKMGIDMQSVGMAIMAVDLAAKDETLAIKYINYCYKIYSISVQDGYSRLLTSLRYLALPQMEYHTSCIFEPYGQTYCNQQIV